MLAVLVVLVVAIRPGDMTAGDARRFAVKAMAAADVDAVSVSGKVKADRFRPARHDPVRVWVVPLRIRNRPVLLSVLRSGEQAVHLDDRASGGGTVLTQRQFLALERYRWDPAGERADRRRAAAVAVVALLVVGALVIAARTRTDGSVRSTV